MIYCCKYAGLYATEAWEGHDPEPISLDDFISELLPNLKGDGVLSGVFCLPSDKGMTPTVDQLLADLSKENRKLLVGSEIGWQEFISSPRSAQYLCVKDH